MLNCLTPMFLTGMWFGGYERPDTDNYVSDPATGARCHWLESQDGDLESRCQDLLEDLDTAWTAQVAWGWHEPFADPGGPDHGGSTGLDIYLSRDAWWGAYTLSDYVDANPDDGLMGSYAYMVIDPRINANEDHLYMAHEFNHVLQYATDFTEYSYPPWEGAATVAEEYTYPGEGSWQTVAVDFQIAPFAGMLMDGYWLYDYHDLYLYYEYGTALWFMYLQDQGVEPPEFWDELVNDRQNWTNEPDAWDAWGTVTGDADLGLLDFALERGRIGTADPPSWSGDFPMGTKMRVTVDALDTEFLPENAPYSTGMAYFEVDLEGPLVLSVDSDSTTRWGAVAVASNAVATAGELPLSFEGPDLVAVVNLGPPGWDPDYGTTQADFTLTVTEGEAETDTDTDTDADTDTDSDTDADTDTDTNTDTTGDTGTDTPADDTGVGPADTGDEGTGGCGCATATPSSAPAWVLGLIGLMGLRRRA